ncbi:MAG: glycoside hydrolase family 36 protein [Armatimonadota bacterium]
MIQLHENGINLSLEIAESGSLRLLHFSALPFQEESIDERHRTLCRLLELQSTGENQSDNHGARHTSTQPGGRLVYVEHRDYRNNQGRKLEFVQQCEGLEVVSHFQFYDDIRIARCWTEMTNIGNSPLGIEYLTSFSLGCLAKEGIQEWHDKCALHVPHNTWLGEIRWVRSSLPDLGMYPVAPTTFPLTPGTMKRISYSVNGTWSCNDFLPMGIFENTEAGTMLFWQIEHNGSWQWEIGGCGDELYLKVSGPNENENHWWKNLAPGEKFVSALVAVGSIIGGVAEAAAELTKYRRTIRRPNRDNENLPVIFNDYMNCLWADPTTEKEIPLIDAAAEVGCEYFCIDAGWHGDLNSPWGAEIGEWMPSRDRFTGGIEELLDYIRSKGMIPGLWLELEVVGTSCPLASKVPDNWFFVRHGKRIIDNGRYQLDFRNPQVRAHADSVVDRLVNEYGVGYIKMDYNINAGIGTELDADSFGDGLLGHNRAYLDWLDQVFERYPDLVIENCGSGGLRMNYALLSRHSIQSSSDQTDYRKYAAIAAASPTACTPEQCAVWSYPLKDGDTEEAAFNMVNAMLLRIHMSGHISQISPENKALITEGIAYYKRIRNDIRHAMPFWPLDLPVMEDGWIALGLQHDTSIHLAVWRADSDEDMCMLPIEKLQGNSVDVSLGYPRTAECSWQWNDDAGILTVQLPKQYSARVFKLECKEQTKGVKTWK